MPETTESCFFKSTKHILWTIIEYELDIRGYYYFLIVF